MYDCNQRVGIYSGIGVQIKCTLVMEMATSGEIDIILNHYQLFSQFLHWNIQHKPPLARILNYMYPIQIHHNQVPQPPDKPQ